MDELKINVRGMMCTGCENRIKNVLGELKGIKTVDANYITGQVVINSDIEINIEEIKSKIEDIGFEVVE